MSVCNIELLVSCRWTEILFSSKVFIFHIRALIVHISNRTHLAATIHCWQAAQRIKDNHVPAECLCLAVAKEFSGKAENKESLCILNRLLGRVSGTGRLIQTKNGVMYTTIVLFLGV